MKSILGCVSACFVVSLWNPVAVIAQTQAAQDYVTDDFVVGATIRPAQFLKSEFFGTLLKAAGQQEVFRGEMQSIQDRLGFDLREAQEITMLLDRRTVLNLAGLPEDLPDQKPNTDAVADAARPTVSETQQKNHLKQLGLAMHNFHAVYNSFPDDDGIEGQGKGNLSWRVHLLPYLGQQQLYQEFDLKAAWDSDHNKALIAKMPDVFASNGVQEKGHTSLHVMIGEDTPFGGDRAPRMRDITDGTSNTLLIAVAGPDQAQAWTKPGGLELQAGPPGKSLGKIGDTFLVAMMDGSVRSLPADLPAATFQHLVQNRDGQVVQLDVETPKTTRLPTWIVRTSTDIDQSAVLESLKPMGNPVEVATPAGTLYTLGDYAVSFPDKKTLLAAASDQLPSLMKANGQATSKMATQLRAGAAKNDITLVADMNSLKVLKDNLAGNLPMAGIVQSVEFLEVRLNISGPADQLQSLTAQMQNAGSAAQLSALLMGLLQMQKAQLMGMANAPNADLPADAMPAMLRLMDTAKIQAEETTVTYQIPKPSDMQAFAEQLKPLVTFTTTSFTRARGAARQAERRNSMKQLGLAFHNFNDVFTRFPRHNGDAGNGPKGLSWRVHLLPFLDEAELYERFRKDEPWDSDHNRTLIEEMPEVFRVPLVDKPGHTTIHVFTGKNAPFQSDVAGPRIRDFTDGTSNTLLAVEAGPETAVVWTKPGGLEFTGDNGLKLLKLASPQFLALFADGAVRSLDANIDKATLHRLIQPQDGEVLGDF